MIILCHGGPIAKPQDVVVILEQAAGVAGFFGASSIERLATEVAITEQVKEFKRLTV